MKKQGKTLQIINILMGLLALAGLVFDFVLFARLKDKMVAFVPLTQLEETLLTVAGFSMLVLLLYYCLSILQVIRTIRHREKLNFLLIFLFVAGVVSLLMVFAVIALLTDIAHQYEAGLAQPEWSLLYPILIPQGVVALAFLLLQIVGYFTHDRDQPIVMDSNIFLIVHYTGAICGGMGFVNALLGLLYPRGWSVFLHTLLTGLVLIFPYGLAILYWFLIKIREKGQPLYDEKQWLDVGRSAFVTLLTVTVGMMVLFAATYSNLGGVVRYLWLPLYLFSVVLIFSLANLYYNNRV